MLSVMEERWGPVFRAGVLYYSSLMNGRVTDVQMYWQQEVDQLKLVEVY